jgi:CDP-diacylglycerol---glycerol-3-phosphate 3-phosphatidyltransferase
MNLPNKITLSRIIIAVIIMVILLIPWSALNITWPTYLVGSTIIDLKYIIVGILFLIASVSDFLDGYLARSRNLVTDYGKIMDAIADKILVNGLLIILAYERIIPVVIPVIIITRDIVVDSCKLVCASKYQVVGASLPGKIKSICMMIGITLTLFYNMPFELLHLDVANAFLLVATLLSVISGCLYYFNAREYFGLKK